MICPDRPRVTLEAGAPTRSGSYELERFCRFFKDGKLVESNKWTIEYKPVTEYVRRGTSTDPDAKAPPDKPVIRLQEPKGESFSMAQ